MIEAQAIKVKDVALIGLESVGKTAVFRLLTGESCGDETNFRGSTVHVRFGKMNAEEGRVIDTPGIRLKSDSETTRIALEQAKEANVLLLVVRSTHAVQEIQALLNSLRATFIGRRVSLVLTYADKMPGDQSEQIKHLKSILKIPIVTLNAKHPRSDDRDRVRTAISQASMLNPDWDAYPLSSFLFINPTSTWFENKIAGPFLAVATMSALFTLPVVLAYKLAAWAQPLVDVLVISPMKTGLSNLFESAPLAKAILIGDYGVLTLGWYSFLWAFPVVMLIGVSVAICDESGLKDRITSALDPCLRWIGLSGRDLIPVLSGYGCNVVAVIQTRACSSCTRKSCLSLIAFGSACSYQIGASLSIFNSASHLWLFAPYLVTLFVVGAIHTRVWNGGLKKEESSSLAERAFLQAPTWRGTWWRVKSVLQQFLYQAMPIFILICAVGALLQYFGLIEKLAQYIAPLLALFGLPPETAVGILFSIVRKDGLLILNQGEGQLLASLSPGQIFMLVYLASTLTACLVTLWAVKNEAGWRHATVLAGRQALTSVASAFLFARVIR